jgi:hypothetical protein
MHDACMQSRGPFCLSFVPLSQTRRRLNVALHLTAHTALISLLRMRGTLLHRIRASGFVTERGRVRSCARGGHLSDRSQVGQIEGALWCSPCSLGLDSKHRRLDSRGTPLEICHSDAIVITPDQSISVAGSRVAGPSVMTQGHAGGDIFCNQACIRSPTRHLAATTCFAIHRHIV